MLKLGRKAIFSALLALGGFQAAEAQLFRVMVINESGAWPHDDAINELSKRITSLSSSMNFAVKTLTASSNPNIVAHMNLDTLRKYHVVIWNNNTSIGNVITNGSPRNNFQQWLKEGGGLVAIHGVMDHADLWPWLRDSVLGGTRFTQHSGWNSGGGANAKVRWDDLPTNGAVQADKPEYALMKKGTPTGWFTYPDEWYSFTINPRSKVDVLLRIDEKTYDVPEKMGDDHPIAWAYKLPLVSGKTKQGRFIYNARGHMGPAFSGTGQGASPGDAWGNATAPTFNFIKYSICWAAAGTAPIDGEGVLKEDCTVEKASPIRPNLAGKMSDMVVLKKKSDLSVVVNGTGNFEVNIYNVSGFRLGTQKGGQGEYLFPNILNKSSVFFVQVRDNQLKQHTKRVAF